MLKECLDVFAEKLKQDNDLILKEYIPTDGSYLIVNKDNKIKYTDIKLDKKTRKIIATDDTLLKDICFFDYHSKLISMNKPVDSKKVIHTNNYLAFAVKKESITQKLTVEIIDNYYDTLKNPLEKKYKKSKEASKIYQKFVDEYGEVNQDLLEKCRKWIKDNIFSIDKLVDVDLKKKEYLKIFFALDDEPINKELFIQEDNRYILPNIYNSNDYNVEVDGEILGIPDNNMGMNAKKPFLSIKTRKVPASYLVDGDTAILQKQFFEYLMNLASNGKNNVYIDINKNTIEAYNDREERKSFSGIDTGYYLRIQKGKELEIHVQDNIADYQDKLAVNFEYQDFFALKIKDYPEYTEKIGTHYTRSSVGELINSIFFSKYLQTNYFTDASDISVKDSILKQDIIMYRNSIFAWVYKGVDINFKQAEEKFALDLIKNAVFNDYMLRAKTQLNLHWSFKDYFMSLEQQGGKKMADIVTDLRESIRAKVLSKDEEVVTNNDREYYYAVGQLMAYFISLSKASKKTQSLINPVLNARNDVVIKERLLQLYKKYNYAIEAYATRVKRLYSMILGYESETKVDQEMILLGYMDNNVIYTKTEEEKTETVETK